METLPVELLHRIFDYLDTETIVFSVRSVSRLFRSVVISYERVVLNLKHVSQPHFHLLCRSIKPQNIISLTLSNDVDASNKIDSFLSYACHLQHYTRLRSLTLECINEKQLNYLLEHLNLTSLTSFSMMTTNSDEQRNRTTKKHLTSIIARLNICRLQFCREKYITPRIEWPTISMIQYLTIESCIEMDDLCKILQCSPYLHTIILKDGFRKPSENSVATFDHRHTFEQLQSLTIEELNVTIDQLELFILSTPAIIHLKLIGSEQNYMSYYAQIWEQFIEINLLQLKKFEFYFNHKFNIKTLEELESINLSFQTPFWIKLKHWFVICEYKVNDSSCFHTYTVPICTTRFTYESGFKQLPSSASTLVTKNKYIQSLKLTLDAFIVDDIEEKVGNI
ncbi:hypothetical protein I4U23_015564 [Adineta vaga]|nr:hypothetical protein I4U23_015564 [Adineta vaga]